VGGSLAQHEGIAVFRDGERRQRLRLVVLTQLVRVRFRGGPRDLRNDVGTRGAVGGGAACYGSGGGDQKAESREQNTPVGSLFTALCGLFWGERHASADAA